MIGADSKAEKPTHKSLSDRVREVRSMMSNLPRAFSMVWQAHRGATVAMLVLTLLLACLPAAQAWVGKLIVDGVFAGLSNQQSAVEAFRLVFPYVLLEFGLFMAATLLNELQTLIQHLLGTRLSHTTNLAIMRKALTLDMHFFEDPTFYDKLQNARHDAGWRSLEIVRASFSLLESVLTTTSFLAILLTFSPLLTLLLLVTTLPAFVARIRNSNDFYGFQMSHTPEARRMYYFEHLLTTDHTIKEVKLFNLGEPLLCRYEQLFGRFYREDIRLARKRAVSSLLWALFGTTSYYGAYAWIVWQTVQGVITLGDMTLYLAICRQAQGSFQQIFFGVSGLYESGLFLDNLFTFLGLKPTAATPDHPLPVPRPIRKGIEFRGVSFRYPGREEWALNDVNLTILPGEKLALVGANGAGKTTLTKLLTRLYDPTEGQILLDGVDLRAYDLDDLRERVGVIFQDFVRYHTTARENIGFGQIAALDDQPRIEGAAQRGGAHEVITALPDGYETMLGHWFERGQELSGGQWQKIALGRAFMRDSEVLVLDEPTAALDAEREYEIFQRFRELTEGRIAILISHRFSTVRMADRIAVIEGGRIAELGSHRELLALDGTYARLFNMQAEGYR